MLTKKYYMLVFDHYMAAVRRVWFEDGVAPGLVLNTRFKGGEVTRARHRLVLHLRNTVGYRRTDEGDEYRIFSEGPQPLPPGWNPISTTELGRLLGLDHSAVVVILRKERLRLETLGKDDGDD